MKLNRNFSDMLSALSADGAEYLVVGGYAVAAHGPWRATKDIDIWIRPTPDNAARAYRALAAFGAPLHDLTIEDLFTPDMVFQIGLAPQRIDILTSVPGVAFDEAWPNRLVVDMDGLLVPFIGIDDLIRNKRTVGRLQDLADIESLQRYQGSAEE